METSTEIHNDSDFENGTRQTNNSSNTTDTTTSSNLTSTGYITILSILIQVVLFFIIIFGNSLVIHAVRCARHLQTRTNYFIVQLAIADILVAVVLPFHIVLFLYRDLLNNIHICLLRYCTVLSTTMLSIFCLTCMTYDRLMVLLYPLHYQLKMTKTKFWVLSVITWLGAFVSGFIPMVWRDETPNFNENLCDYATSVKFEYLQLQVTCFSGLTLIIMGMYSKIFYIAFRNKARSVERRQQQSNDPSKTSSDLKLKHAFTITKTCAIVMGTYIVCWLPFTLTVMIQIYSNNLQNQTLLNMRTIFTFLAISNSAMNPIIYAAR